jgi:hypothetical protein
VCAEMSCGDPSADPCILTNNECQSHLFNSPAAAVKQVQFRRLDPPFRIIAPSKLSPPPLSRHPAAG